MFHKVETSTMTERYKMTVWADEATVTFTKSEWLDISIALLSHAGTWLHNENVPQADRHKMYDRYRQLMQRVDALAELD